MRCTLPRGRNQVVPEKREQSFLVTFNSQLLGRSPIRTDRRYDRVRLPVVQDQVAAIIDRKFRTGNSVKRATIGHAFERKRQSRCFPEIRKPTSAHENGPLQRTERVERQSAMITRVQDDVSRQDQAGKGTMGMGNRDRSGLMRLTSTFIRLRRIQRGKSISVDHGFERFSRFTSVSTILRTFSNSAIAF